MRRDLCYHFYADTKTIFDAYLSAIRDTFDKGASGTPFIKISFGLDFSFKYNMNGGAGTVRFMPLNDGTAVNIRYSIAQAWGARYEAHAEKINSEVSKRIGVQAKPFNINVEEFVEEFVKYEINQNRASAQATGQFSDFCPSCGAGYNGTPKFCTTCGKVIPPKNVSRSCPACHSVVAPGANFCARCGAKQS